MRLCSLLAHMIADMPSSAENSQAGLIDTALPGYG